MVLGNELFCYSLVYQHNRYCIGVDGGVVNGERKVWGGNKWNKEAIG